MNRFDYFIALWLMACWFTAGMGIGRYKFPVCAVESKAAMGKLTLEELCNRPKYPSQRAFHESIAAETMLFGGMGSGKSDPLCEKAIHLSWSIPGNEGFLGRAHETELEDHTIPQFFGLCPDEIILNWEKGPKRLTVRSYDPDQPSVIWFGHVGDPQPGKDHLKGGNWGWFGIDQAESIPENRWNDLKGRLRRKSSKTHPAFGNANPNGHDWCWRRWIYPAEQGGHVETLLVPGKIGGQAVEVESKRYRAGRSKFAIAAQTAENLSLPDDYITDKMENNPPEWVDRYINCGFEGWSGRVYKEYSEVSVHNIDPFPIPTRWATVVSIDVGGDSPWAIGTLRTDPDNGDEFVTAEFHDKTILLRDIAAWIKNPERSRIRDWRTARFICDPENKQVIFELAAEHQIMCEAARKGPKLPGISLVAGYLHPHQGRIRHIPGQLLPDGSRGTLVVKDAPRLFVFRDCYNWRREHANWRWKRDPRTNEPLNEPEDKDDHSCDYTIYGLRVHPAPIDLEQQDTELENLKLVDPASYREALYRLKGEDKKTRLVDVWGSQDAQEDRRLPW